jgi:hypothetical protein
MGQLTLLLVALAAVAIATSNLGLGFWIGRSTQVNSRGSSTVPRDLRRKALRHAARKLNRCLLATTDLSDEATALARLVADHQACLPVELVLAFGRITTSIKALEGHLNACLRSVPAPAHERPVSAGRTCSHPERAPSADPRPSDAPNLGFEGKRYNTVQDVAAWNGEGLPDDSTFIPVHCQKLSTAELTYFADEPPVSDRVAVRLRSGETEIILGAKVLEHRRASFADRWCCRIQCRFVERLKNDDHAAVLTT